MSWDYELARAMRPQKQGPPGLEGKVVSTAPLTISLLDGAVTEHTIQRLPWQVGDRVACLWMGKTLVILGRLEEP